MSQLGVILQESLRTHQPEPRTILGLLTEQMDAAADGPPRTRTRRTFKDRLGFIGIGCCGATWRFRSDSITVRHEEQEQQQQPQQQQQHQQHQPLLLETNQARDPNRLGPDCVSPTPASSGMNLAAALAAERQLRGPPPQEAEVGERRGVPGTPWRVSLMRLLEETDGGDAEVSSAAKTSDEDKISGSGGGVGNDWVCCVCMGRKKGAAFIPCGHTFCRVCSRELWLNRGSCPLCNRSILEILDIF